MSKTFAIAILCFVLTEMSCKRPCTIVKATYLTGAKKDVYTYLNCIDTSYYLKESYYPNGKLKWRAHYINDVEDGLCTSWNSDGVKTAEWTVKDGLAEGMVSDWYDNGNKKEETNYHKGLEQGIAKTWYQSGKLQSRCMFKDGKLHGEYAFNTTDSTWIQCIYNENYLWGSYTERYKDSVGMVRVAGMYKKDLKEGMWRWYLYDTILIKLAEYENDRVNGSYAEYYINGNLKIQGKCINDTFNGQIQHYDVSGNPIN